MIVLDTHLWLWWINQDPARLKPAWTARIASAEPIGISAISCFEIAWLTQHGRIEISIAVDDWFDKALLGWLRHHAITDYAYYRSYRRSTPGTSSRSPGSTDYRYGIGAQRNSDFRR